MVVLMPDLATAGVAACPYCIPHYNRGVKYFSITKTGKKNRSTHHHFEAIGCLSYKVTMRYWIVRSFGNRRYDRRSEIGMKFAPGDRMFLMLVLGIAFAGFAISRRKLGPHREIADIANIMVQVGLAWS